MSVPAADSVRQTLDHVYRQESRRVLATLIRLLADFDLAEDALHDAFRAAAEQWPRDGVPANPRAWLVSTGRFKAIDALRKHARHETPLSDAHEQTLPGADTPDVDDVTAVVDDRLRLIFTCCHPALPSEGRVALTLREVCGLTTEAIAHAFLSTPPAIAQRIVRAKAKIRAEHIPYEVPAAAALPSRLGAVLQVIYLIFNEGYVASSGETLMRLDLTAEAVRLGRLLVELLPESEAIGLLGLMLLHESRRQSRTTPDGDMILLEDQDRSLWDKALIKEGVTLSEQAMAGASLGPYALQAALTAVHAQASDMASTDWPRLVALYDSLLERMPSPVIELNRAVAVAMRDDPAAGLMLVDGILGRGELTHYHLAYSVRASLLVRQQRLAEARVEYQRALNLTVQATERRFLEHRLQKISSNS